MNTALYSSIKIRYLTNLFISANIRLIIYYVSTWFYFLIQRWEIISIKLELTNIENYTIFFENQLDSYGIENVDEIMNMDLTLIKRKQK